MKYLITRNKFINEMRIVKLELPELNVDFINSKLNYTWNIYDDQIWKGVWKGVMSTISSIFYIENTERTEQGDSKEIIEKLPSWYNFSNRYKSIIATSNENYATSWGNLKCVIPLKNEIIVGVSRDFNGPGCFPFVDDLFPTYKNDFGDIKNIIFTILSYTKFKGLWTSQILTSTNEDFKEILIELRKNKIVYHKLSELIHEKNIKNMLELIDYILDPIRNGYKKMKYTDFIKNKDPNVEVWFECDCFLINDTHLFSWLDRYGTH